MAAAVLDRPAPPMPRTLQFRLANAADKRGGTYRLPPPEKLQFPLAPIRVDPSEPTAEALDAVIAEILREYGHEQVRIERAAFSLIPPPLTGLPEVAKRPTFTITVRHDRRDDIFGARADVTLAFGSGDTVGQAVRDCADDFFARVESLLADHETLGPALREERRELERWWASAAK